MLVYDEFDLNDYAISLSFLIMIWSLNDFESCNWVECDKCDAFFYAPLQIF